MKHLFILIVITMLGIGAYGQKNWSVSTAVGFNITNIKLYGVPSPYNAEPFDATPDILIDLKVHKNLSKHWEVGLSAETGNMQTRLWRKFDYYQGGVYLYSASDRQLQRLISPFVMPALFAHYKINYGKKSHLFAGPVLGMMTGSNEINLGRNITCAAGGANLGTAIGIGQHTKLQLSGGWRIAYVNLRKTDGIVTPINDNGDYFIRRYSEDVVHYFSITVGIIAVL